MKGGAINLLLRSLGLGTPAQPQGFLGNPSTALPTLIVVLPVVALFLFLQRYFVNGLLGAIKG